MSSMRFDEKMGAPSAGWKMNADFFYKENMSALRSGRVILDMRDGETGEQLAYFEKDNIVTLDAGILTARLFTNSQNPNAGQHNGINMLAIGSGALGNLLSPNAPSATQRRLNNELGRKPFSKTQFRDGGGLAVAYETNVVDYTTVFAEGEAVGAWNEMALMSTFSSNPATTNPIMNGPTGYDPTIDVSELDILGNYLTFSVISKASTAVVGLTWRLTY